MLTNSHQYVSYQSTKSSLIPIQSIEQAGPRRSYWQNVVSVELKPPTTHTDSGGVTNITNMSGRKRKKESKVLVK